MINTAATMIGNLTGKEASEPDASHCFYYRMIQVTSNIAKKRETRKNHPRAKVVSPINQKTMKQKLYFNLLDNLYPLKKEMQ
jgi:hypothetical protein